jgi:hypothetical protein
MLTVPKLRSATSAAAADAITAPPGPPEVVAKQKIDIYKVPLSRPLQTHAGAITTLALREPIAEDYIEIGRVPTSVRGRADTDQEILMDHKCMGLWAVKLAKLDAVTIGMLPARDWITLCSHVNAILIQAGIDDVGN